MTTLVLVPLTLQIVLGSPLSSSCSQTLPPYRVQAVEALTGVPVGLPVDAVRLSYSVDGKVLTVSPVATGRIFCSGFESGESKQQRSNKL